MQLVERHIINRNHKFFAEIDNLSFLAKNLYNAATFIYRQDFFAHKQTDATEVYHTLKNTTDYKSLPAKVSTDVLRRVFKSWQSYYQAIKEYQRNPTKFTGMPRIPNYKGSVGNRSDGRFVVGYNLQAVSKKALKKGLAHPSGTNIFLPTKVVEKIDEIRLVPRTGCYVVEVVYTIEITTSTQPKNRVAAIDLGLNNLAVLAFNIAGIAPQIYDGRAIKAANQYCNKSHARFFSLLQKNQAHPRYVAINCSTRINKLWQKRNCKVDYYLHTTSSAIIKQLVINQIGKLIIGWNQRFKDSINIGKINNQKFVSIPHYRFVAQLRYKAAMAGIEVIEHEESCTCVCSALDLEPLRKHDNYQGKRVKRGLFITSTGKHINADLNGALNIGRKVVGNGFIPHPIEAVVVQPLRVKPYKCKIG